MHTYGKSLRDLVRLRAGDIPRIPDVVVYPGTEAEVQLVVDRAVAADAVLIPFGGGSNIAGSLEPRADEKRVIISLDMGRLRKVIDIDEESGLAVGEVGELAFRDLDHVRIDIVEAEGVAGASPCGHGARSAARRLPQLGQMTAASVRCGGMREGLASLRSHGGCRRRSRR